MKRSKYYFLLGLLAVLPFLQMGCTRLDLETYPGEGPVNIAFNWSNLLAGDSVPVAMKLCFYGKDSVITRDCKDSVYRGMLPNGSYQVIAYNIDAKNVMYNQSDTYMGTEAIAQTRNSDTKAISYLSQPYHLYGIGLGSITVLGDSVVNETATPLPFVKKIHVKYTVTGEKQAIASCNASLSGIAMSVNIASGKVSGKTGTVLFKPSSTSYGFESMVTFFGIADVSTNNLSTVLDFTGGGNQTLDVNIAAALTEVNDATIPIDVNLDIAVTGNVGAGFGATLTGWTVDTENVIVE